MEQNLKVEVAVVVTTTLRLLYLLVVHGISILCLKTETLRTRLVIYLRKEGRRMST